MQQDFAQQKWQMKGKIYNYDTANRLVAFTNDVQSDKVIIYIGGLGDTLLSTPFTSQLSDFCTLKKIRLVIPQLRTMPNYRTFLISSDVQDVQKVVLENQGRKIILLGHSTGCQVSMVYLTTHGSQKLYKVILQAPVSDVEYQESINPGLKQQLQQARTTKYFIPQSDGKVWLSERFLSLNERFNTQDWFSTHLPDQNYSDWKKFKIPIITIVCGKDKYAVLSNIDKLRVGSQLFIIQGATHSMHQAVSRQQFLKILAQKI